MPTTVLHIADPAKIDKPTPDPKAGKDGGKPAEKKADVEKSEAKKADKKEEKIERRKEAIATGETVKKAAAQIKSKQEKEEKVDAPVDVTTIIHESPHPDFIVEEAKKGYDLMLIGLAKTSDAARTSTKAWPLWPWASRDRWRSSPCAAISPSSPTANSAFWCR